MNFKLTVDPNIPTGVFLQGYAQRVIVNDHTYFFLPFWFKEQADGSLEAVALDGNLPDELKDAIEKMRERKP